MSATEIAFHPRERGKDFSFDHGKEPAIPSNRANAGTTATTMARSRLRTFHPRERGNNGDGSSRREQFSLPSARARGQRELKARSA